MSVETVNSNSTSKKSNRKRTTVKSKSRKLKVKSNKKSIVKPKNKPSYCAPSVDTQNTVSNSCFTRDALVKIADAWNNQNKDNLIKYNTRTSNNSLWEKINNKMKSKKCNKEWCWTKQDFVKSEYNIEDDKLFDVFRPFMPKSWEKNPRQWLNTLDIRYVMRQYENKYTDFKFIGPVPIDFDTELSFGSCVVNEICKINITDLYNKGIYRVGIIFNLDKHNEPGSHWIALMCDLTTCNISYWDSYGFEPPKEVITLMNRLKEQCNKMGKKMKININKVRHQYKNSECGVYSINFLVNLLEGKTFKQATEKIVDDDKMFAKRSFYFIKG